MCGLTGAEPDEVSHEVIDFLNEQFVWRAEMPGGQTWQIRPRLRSSSRSNT